MSSYCRKDSFFTWCAQTFLAENESTPTANSQKLQLQDERLFVLPETDFPKVVLLQKRVPTCCPPPKFHKNRPPGSHGGWGMILSFPTGKKVTFQGQTVKLREGKPREVRLQLYLQPLQLPTIHEVCARKGAQVVLLNRDSIRADEAYGYIRVVCQMSEGIWKIVGRGSTSKTCCFCWLVV